MSVREYVGARYVPKFADPVEWTGDTSYEALTIVTYNNSSYTSKIPVPATVGNPAQNTDYWALTGNYNAQTQEAITTANEAKIVAEKASEDVAELTAKIDDIDSGIYENAITLGMDNTGATDISDILYGLGGGTNVGFPKGTYKVSKSGSVGCQCVFVEGAVLNVDSNVTVTFNGAVDASRYNIFSGTGSVKLNGNGTIYPEWFGAKNDGTTDCYDAFTKCFNSFTDAYVSLENGVMTQSNAGPWVASDRCYYVSEPITFNKTFSTLGCSGGYAVIFSTKANVITIGGGSALERVNANNICFVSGITATSLSNDDSANYIVRFIGGESCTYSNIRAVGNPLAYYITNTVSCYFDKVVSTSATDSFYTGNVRTFYIDCSERNYSDRFIDCSVSYSGSTSRNTYAFYIDGNVITDLYFNRCETNHVDYGVYIDAQTSAIRDVYFSHCVFDETYESAIYIKNSYAGVSDINIDNCYFERPATRTATHGLIHIDNTTLAALYVNARLRGNVFWDRQHNVYSFNAGYSIVTETGDFYLNCGEAINAANTFISNISNCTFHNSEADTLDNFVSIGNGGIVNCGFINQSGDSTLDEFILTGPSSTIVGCSFNGFYTTKINGTTPVLCINADTEDQNVIPGFARSTSE